MNITRPDKVEIPEGVLTDAEAISLLEQIFAGDRPDALLGVWILQLERATGCPHVLNLIKYRNASETPADILRKAREYRPICL